MANFFQAARGGSRGSGMARVSIESEPSPAMNPDGTHDVFGETIEEATLPNAEAIEWLVARGCSSSEARRMVGQVDTTFIATATGAVPTTTEWELDQPVTPNHDA